MDFMQPTGEQTLEDRVHYELYVADGGTLLSSVASLLEVQSQCMEEVRPFVDGYIWQHEPFGLQVSTDVAGLERLEGSVLFGDSVDDEWLVVSLLLHLTRKVPSLVGRVWDSDGDFLLIEAAYAADFPQWLEPETSANRIFLKAGALHILPQTAALPPTPTLAQALSFLFAPNKGAGTEAPEAVAESVQQRVRGLPAAALQQLHHARCLLPRPVARILAQHPQLLAASVSAFYTRTPRDLQAAQRMRHFPPEDLVPVLVTFNRAQYAQLASQQFHAPRGFPVPPATHPDHRAAERGMKLTCAFEMMYSAALPHLHRSTAEGVRDSPRAAEGDVAGSEAAALEADAEWRRFRGQLEARGYFREAQGVIPGSAQHRHLTASALHMYKGTEQYRRSTAALAEPAVLCSHWLRQLADAAENGGEPSTWAALRGPVGPEEGEDDSWLASGEDQMEAELARRQKEMMNSGDFDDEDDDAEEDEEDEDEEEEKGGAAPGPAQQEEMRGGGGETGGAGEEHAEPEVHQATEEMQHISARMQAFMNRMSGLEGVEVESVDPDSPLEGQGRGQPTRREARARSEHSSGPSAGGGGQPCAAPAGGGRKGGHKGGRVPQAPQVPPDDEDLEMDPLSFFNELRQALGLPEEAWQGSEGSSSSAFGGGLLPEDSSDDNDDNDDDDDDDEQQPLPRHIASEASAGGLKAGRTASPALGGTAAPKAGAQAERAQGEGLAAVPPVGEVECARLPASFVRGGRFGAGWDGEASASDSDDESSSDGEDDDQWFMESYAATMERQLRDTSLQATFETSDKATSKTQEAESTARDGAAQGDGGSGQGAAEDDLDEDGDAPVNIDLNLVKSLLASYSAQEGLPGPATNLLGMMGVSLPDNRE